MKKNIEFDNTTNANKVVGAYINKCIEENIDGLDNEILSLIEASRNEGIYLWGAGKYGRILEKYLAARAVKINGIIDNNILTEGNEKSNVIPFENVDDGAKIFIAVSDKEANEDIVKQVMSRHNRTVIARFQDLYNNI